MAQVAWQARLAAFMLVGFALAGTAGAEPFVTYEDWTTSQRIRADRWRGLATSVQDVEKEQRGHAVHMRLRREGSAVLGVGSIGAVMELAMANPPAVEQIEADFKITRVTLEGCPEATFFQSTALPAQISLGNLYDETPRLPGERTGDHFARISTLRRSTSFDLPDAFQVQAVIFRCADAGCAGATVAPGTLFAFLGRVFVGDRFALRLVWDPANSRFLAGLNAEEDVELRYPESLVTGAAVPFAALSMTAAGANCTAGAGVSDATVEIGEVRTNVGAVISGRQHEDGGDDDSQR